MQDPNHILPVTIVGFASVIIGCFTGIISVRIINDNASLTFLFGNLTYLLMSTLLVFAAGLVQFLSSLYLLCQRQFLQRWINLNSYVFLALILSVCICIPMTTSPYQKLQKRQIKLLKDLESGSSSLENQTRINGLNTTDWAESTKTTTMKPQILNNIGEINDHEFDLRSLNDSSAENSNEMQDFNHSSLIIVPEDEVEPVDDDDEFQFQVPNQTTVTTNANIYNDGNNKEKNDNDNEGGGPTDLESIQSIIIHLKVFYGIILVNFMFLPIALGFMAKYVESRFRIVRSK